QTAGTHPRALQVAEHTIESTLLGRPQCRQLLATDSPRFLKTGALGQSAPDRGGTVQQPPECAGTANRTEANRKINLRPQDTAALELRAMFGNMALEALTLTMAWIQGGERPLLVGLSIEAAGDAENLKVGLEHVGKR